MEEVITCKNVSIGYKSPLLSDINIAVGKEVFIAVLGENGRGKSTFLKTIAADLPPLAGSIELFGKFMHEWERPKLSGKLAAVWTGKVNIGLISVEEFIAFGRYPFTNWLAKMRKEDEEYIHLSLEMCGIEHLKTKDLQELSDGERQKVMIARAIAQNTEVIILDEPTTHLDLKNTAEIFNLLKELSRDHGKTVLVSTHKVEIALQIADQVILISENSVVQDTAENLLASGAIEKEFASRFMQFDRSQKRFFWK